MSTYFEVSYTDPTAEVKALIAPNHAANVHTTTLDVQESADLLVVAEALKKCRIDLWSLLGEAIAAPKGHRNYFGAAQAT